VTHATITFSANGRTYLPAVPDSEITFSTHLSWPPQTSRCFRKRLAARSQDPTAEPAAVP
jgi:hypothetical protein